MAEEVVPQGTGKEPQQKLVMILVCWMLGTLGIHRYMMGYDNWWKMLVTLGGCGVWTIMDLIKLFTDQLPMADGTPLKKD
jgi:TM2 domain-containing membrane protein YozV